MLRNQRSHRSKGKNRVKAVVALFLCIICIGAVSAFAILHFEIHATAKDKNTVSNVKSSKVNENSSASPETSSASQSSTSMSPATATVSAVTAAILPSQISLQDATKPLQIHVSIATQNVTVYDANNKIVESFICSTGSSGYDTPTGTFTVYNRGKSFFSKEYQEGGYYWVAFYKDYYFHSVPFDKNWQIIPAIANALGHEDSHGCVHLTVQDSEWMYDNIPNGTKVVVE